MTRVYLTTQWSKVDDRVESPLGIRRLNYGWPDWTWGGGQYDPTRWRTVLQNKLHNETNRTRFELGSPVFVDAEHNDPEVIADIARIAREEFVAAGDAAPRIAVWVAGADWLNACGKPGHADFEQRMDNLRSKLEAIADAGLWGVTPFLYRGNNWSFNALVENSVALVRSLGMKLHPLVWVHTYPNPDSVALTTEQIKADVEWIAGLSDAVLLVANGGGDPTDEQWEAVREATKVLNCCGPGGSSILSPIGRRHAFVTSANLDAARAAMQRIDRDPDSTGGFVSAGSGLYGLSTIVDEQQAARIAEMADVAVYDAASWTYSEARADAFTESG